MRGADTQTILVVFHLNCLVLTSGGSNSPGGPDGPDVPGGPGGPVVPDVPGGPIGPDGPSG